MKYFLIAGLLLNFIAFAGYALDKWLARRNRSRISEARLYQLAFIGPIGAILGVWWVRHKTRKMSFLVPFFATIIGSFVVHGLIIAFFLRTPDG